MAEDEPSEKLNQSERDKLIQDTAEITKHLHKTEGKEKASPPGRKRGITKPTSTIGSPTITTKSEDDKSIDCGKLGTYFLYPAGV